MLPHWPYLRGLRQETRDHYIMIYIVPTQYISEIAKVLAPTSIPLRMYLGEI